MEKTIIENELLPSHYVKQEEPAYKGKATHNVFQLEQMCEDYKSLVHQLRIRKQTIEQKFSLTVNENDLLPSSYKKQDEPAYHGRGNHMITDLEDICEGYKNLVHQLRVMELIIIKKFNIVIINPLSELVKVIKLDWEKLNPELTEYMHERKPETKNDKWFYYPHFCGLIYKNPVYILIDKEGNCMPPEIFDIRKKIIGFSIGIFTGKNVEPENYFKLPIEDLEKTRTKEIVSLPEFMGESYKLNETIEKNEIILIEYLKTTTYFNKK
jgi:hypothetical protein